MFDLAIVSILHLILRTLGDSPLNGIISTSVLGLMMVPCYFLGGWTSVRSALGWLVQYPRYGILVLVGVAMSLVMGVAIGHNPALFCSELILGYFFFHAFFAVTHWLVKWASRRLW